MKTLVIISKKIVLFQFFVVICTRVFAQPSNDNCSSATLLVSGAAATCSQTTSGASVQTGEVTTAATVGASSNFSSTVWYRFVASSAAMFVELEITGTPSCASRLAMVVYNSSTCLPASTTILQNQQYNSDGAMVINLTGLTVGSTYRVQVGYSTSALCLFHPTYCIKVGNSPATCSCSNPCTTGCGYATAPTVSQVVASCPIFDLNPLSDGGTTKTYCYSFVAASPLISFNMIITSNCGSGNVSAFTWTLQRSSCGSNVASGTLSSMLATGLIVGQSYVLCYTYTIPTGCYHSSLYPYFIGASALPLTLTHFEVKKKENKPHLTWVMEQERDIMTYRILSSTDGVIWEHESSVQGTQSYTGSSYSYTDENASGDVIYYKLLGITVEGEEVEFEDNLRSYDNNVSTKSITSVHHTDLNGRTVNSEEHGFIFEVTHFDDGTTSVTKKFLP